METLEQVQRMAFGAYDIQGEAGKKCSGGKIIHVYKYVLSRSLSVVPSDEARGNGHKLKGNAENTI